MQRAAALNELVVCGLDLASARLRTFETAVTGLPACWKVTFTSEEPPGNAKITGPSARCGFPSDVTTSQSIKLDPVPVEVNGKLTWKTFTPGTSSYCLRSLTTLPENLSPDPIWAGRTRPTSLLTMVGCTGSGIAGRLCRIFCSCWAALRAASRCFTTSS